MDATYVMAIESNGNERGLDLSKTQCATTFAYLNSSNLWLYLVYTRLLVSLGEEAVDRSLATVATPVFIYIFETFRSTFVHKIQL